jgi:hypothetical protein
VRQDIDARKDSDLMAVRLGGRWRRFIERSAQYGVVVLVVGFFVFEVFLFFGTAVHRNAYRDYGQGDSGRTCSAYQPMGYECLLDTLCRRPEGCSQSPGKPFLCCTGGPPTLPGPSVTRP